MLSTILFARLLGAKGMGQYTVAFSVFALLVIPVQFGLPQLVVRETAKAIVKKNWALVRGVWRWSQLTTFAGGTLIALLIGIWMAVTGVDTETRNIYVFGLIYVPLFALLTTSGGALLGLGHVILGQLPEHILKPVLLLVSIATVVAVHPVNGFTPMVAMGCQAVGVGIALLASVFMLVRMVPEPVKLETRLECHTSVWLAAAGSLGLLSGLNLLMGNLDIVMLGWLRPIDEAGIYRVAVATSAVVSFGLQATNLVVMPAIARLYDSGDTMALQKLLYSNIRFVIVVGLAAFGIVVVLGQWLLGALFGPAFEAAYWPLIILAMGQLLNAAFGPVGILLNMSGHEKETLLGLTFAAVLNGILNIVLIPGAGMIGAAVASSVALTFWNVFLYRRARARTGMDCSAYAALLGR